MIKIEILCMKVRTATHDECGSQLIYLFRPLQLSLVERQKRNNGLAFSNRVSNRKKGYNKLCISLEYLLYKF